MVSASHVRCWKAVKAALARAGYPSAPQPLILAQEETDGQVSIYASTIRTAAQAFRDNPMMSEAIARASRRRDECPFPVLASLILVDLDGWALVTDIADDPDAQDELRTDECVP